MNDKIIELNNENFDKIISDDKHVVLVDFWAEWCGPCRRQGAVLDELAEKLDEKVIIAKVNVDDNPDIAIKFGIMSIPTLIVFKKGKTEEKTVGLTDSDELMSMLEEYI